MYRLSSLNFHGNSEVPVFYTNPWLRDECCPSLEEPEELCPQFGAGWNRQRQNLALSDGEMKAGIVLTSMNAPWVGGEQEEL